MYVIHTMDGSPYTMSGIRRAWKRAVARARNSYIRACETRGDIPNDTMYAGITIEDLRPKALTDAEAAGYDVQELNMAAAHSSVTTTEGYLKTYREPLSHVELSMPTRKKLDTQVDGLDLSA